MSELPPGVEPARPPEPRDSALGVVVRPSGGRGWRVLLGKRSRRSKFMPGHLAFPGGHLEGADAPGSPGALERCASREVAEETGVSIAPEAWIPAGARITPPMFPVRFDARFFVAALPEGAEPPAASPAPEEIESLAFLDPREVVRRWADGGVLVPPPVLPVLRALAGLGAGSVDEVASALRAVNRREEVHPRIEFVPGIWMLPLATRTLPPATHTNAWMPGGTRFVVFDPGSDDPAEIERLLEVVRRRGTEDGAAPCAVVLTHHHGDHVAGAAIVASALGVPVRAHDSVLTRVDLRGAAAEPLADGDVLDLGGEALETLHTPGHAPGHLAFLVRRARALVAGDLISGMSTILIDPVEGDMGAYLDSLRRVAAVEVRTVLPAHGPPQPARALARLIEHRERRESLVLDALDGGPAGVGEIAGSAYRDVPEMPLALTSRQVLAHLLDLERRGVVRRDDPAGDRWSREPR